MARSRLSNDIRAVVSQARGHRQRRLEIGTRHLSGEEAPRPGLHGGREVDLPHLDRMPAQPLVRLLLLEVLVGHEDGEVRRAQRAGQKKTLDPHRAARRRHRHVLRPDTVDVVEVEQVGLVELRFDGLLERGPRLRQDAVHPREDVLGLHLGIAAVVRKPGGLADGEAVVEIARRKGRAEHEVAGAHGVGGPLYRQRVGAFRVGEDLALQFRVAGERDGVEVQARAGEGQRIADLHGGSRRRVCREVLLPHALELDEFRRVGEMHVGLEDALERAAAIAQRSLEGLQAAARLRLHERRPGQAEALVDADGVTRVVDGIDRRGEHVVARAHGARRGRKRRSANSLQLKGGHWSLSCRRCAPCATPASGRPSRRT